MTRQMAQWGAQGALPTQCRGSCTNRKPSAASIGQQRLYTSRITLAQPPQVSPISSEDTLERETVLQQWANHKMRRKPSKPAPPAGRSPGTSPVPEPNDSEAQPVSHQDASNVPNYTSNSNIQAHQQAVATVQERSKAPAVIPPSQALSSFNSAGSGTPGQERTAAQQPAAPLPSPGPAVPSAVNTQDLDQPSDATTDAGPDTAVTKPNGHRHNIRAAEQEAARAGQSMKLRRQPLKQLAALPRAGGGGVQAARPGTRLPAVQDVHIKPSQQQEDGDSAAASVAVAARGLQMKEQVSDGSVGDTPQLTPEQELLMQLCSYRPADMNDSRAQVSSSLPYNRQALSDALAAAASQQLLHSFSLQQLCFLAAGLAASQHPCSAPFYKHLCEVSLLRLEVCVQQLKLRVAKAQAQAGSSNSLQTRSLNSRQFHSAYMSPSSTASGPASPVAGSGQAQQVTSAPAVGASRQASYAPGTSLSMYSAGSLVMGLLRMRLFPPGDSTSPAVQDAGTQAVPDQAGPWTARDARAAMDAAHRIRRLMLVWLQVSLQGKTVSPWSKRRSARWLANLAWGLSSLPHHLVIVEQQMIGWAVLPPSTLTSSAQGNLWPAPACAALPRVVVQAVVGCVLARRGQIARMLPGQQAIRLASVISCTEPAPARPARHSTVTHGDGRTPHAAQSNSGAADGTQSSAVDYEDQNSEDEDEGLDGQDRAGWSAPGRKGIMYKDLGRAGSGSAGRIAGRLALLGFSPAWRLAVRRLVRKVHAEVGMMTPEDLCGVVAHVATAGDPLVQEAYAGLLAGARARRVVSLMHRVSKLVRARIHRIKLTEQVVLLTCLTVLLRRDVALQAPVLPDGLVLDEVARWTGNKLRNAIRPEQVVGVVTSLASIRWYNPVWWSRVGAVILRLSTSWGGIAAQHVQHILAAYAAVGCCHLQLFSHFTELLLLAGPTPHGSPPHWDDQGNTDRMDYQHQKQTISPAMACSMLASIQRVGYMHVGLYDHLATIMCDPEGASHHVLHPGVTPQAICRLAAGCAALGHVPTVLLEQAVQAAVQANAQALQQAGALGSGFAAVGEQQEAEEHLQPLADAAYALMLHDHPATQSVLAAFMRCLNQQVQGARGQRLSNMSGNSAAAVLLSRAVGLSPHKHTAGEQELVMRYQDDIRRYWQARTGPWTTPSLGPSHLEKAALVESQLVEMLNEVGATGIRRHNSVGAGRGAKINGLRQAAGGGHNEGISSVPDGLVQVISPDVSCSMALGDVSTAGGAGGEHKQVCFLLSSQKRARLIPASGEVSGVVAGSRYSDVLLRVQALRVVCGPGTLVVLVDVERWLSYDTASRKRTLLFHNIEDSLGTCS